MAKCSLDCLHCERPANKCRGGSYHAPTPYTPGTRPKIGNAARPDRAVKDGSRPYRDGKKY